MYDDKLNKNALKVLLWAPLFMLCFGYWMISNPQILGNELNPILLASEPYDNNHYWY